jgi:tetratricopeptide (TPR) repeat protein
MTRARSLVVAFGMATGMVFTALVGTTTVLAAESPERKVTTKAVAEALKKAQAAMSAKQWDAAIAEINKAAAVEKKTPFETYQIDEFRGFVLIQQKKYGEAAPVFERMLTSGFLPPEKVDDTTRTVATLYFQLKDYNKSAQWSKKWLEKNPNNEDITLLLGQSYYLTNDFKNTAATMGGLVNHMERNGQVPKENYIQLVLSSQVKTENRDGILDALKKMVRYYPKPEYWANLLDIYSRKEHTDRVTLGFYRLMLDTGTLKRPADYQEAAQLAMDAGVPGEAQYIVEKGIENGALKSDDKTEQGRYDRLLAGAKKQAATDRASLPQLAKEAEKSPKGQADVGLGQAYLSYNEYDNAITAMERGIKKGGVTDVDEAQVSLGIAHLKKGQKDAARQAFKAVKQGSNWSDLAELWSLRAQGPTQTAATESSTQSPAQRGGEGASRSPGS